MSQEHRATQIHDRRRQLNAALDALESHVGRQRREHLHRSTPDAGARAAAAQFLAAARAELDGIEAVIAEMGS